MRKCLKILNLLIEKKVAETEGDELKVRKYEGMIKCHVEKCPDCRAFLQGMREKTKEEEARKLTELEESLRSKQEIIKEFKGSGGKETIFKACVLEIITDYRDLKKEEIAEAETIARELVKVQGELHKIKQALNLS